MIGQPEGPASCGSCGVHSCDFNAEAILCRIPLSQEAWILDEVWPEFDTYLAQRNAVSALGFVPWSGLPQFFSSYRWSSLAERKVTAAPGLTLRRSLAMRSSRVNGGKRQAILERFDRLYASAYAKKLPYPVGRLIIWQNFLPFLFQDKTLGGREFEILMWRAPRHVLEASLDLAAKYYPEASTLRDFRSMPGLADAEQKAFERATRIITPHQDLAKLYPEKTYVLPWTWPSPLTRQTKAAKIGFLGPTVARRGAFVVRAAIQKLGVPLVVLGRNLEHPDFWNGLRIEERPLEPRCLDDISLLLSPTITDFKPRRLMQALRNGITVISTTACGLPPVQGLHFTDPFDADALAQKIAILSSTPPSFTPLDKPAPAG
jgi:hypothetical protein